ncbi:MAG: ADP-ribosylglycohydrolase family protein [Clostridia bacterium]|nr:ADP-ribosylglycohydrolase family protein [Clostridia bacterium]
MIGAAIGDVVGSRFEFQNHKDKDFALFTPRNKFTDDTVMTMAIAVAVMDHKEHNRPLGEAAVYWMRKIGQPYKKSGYGGRFSHWMYSENPEPYNSFGNGSAMRVSACGWAAESLEDAIRMSNEVTEVTHNHPYGMTGAAVTTAAIYLARTGKSKDEIKKYIEENFDYDLNFTTDEIRPTYRFNETCQGTVPVALVCFLESLDFEDCLRLSISVGGDSDTLAAIACSIAEAYYGVPWTMRLEVDKYLDKQFLDIIEKFEKMYPTRYL